LADCLLWKLQSRNPSEVSFLFGSMHVKDKRAIELAKPAMDLLSKLDVLYLEVNPLEVDPSAMSSAFKLPEGLVLRDLYPEKSYERLKVSLIKYAGIDPDMYTGFLPLYLLNLAYESMLSTDYGYPMDILFFNLARKKGLTIQGLETFEDQLSKFNEVPLKVQANALMDLSRRYTSHRRKLKELFYEYLDQNIHTLYRKNKNQLGPLRKPFLYDRNFLMADRISDSIVGNNSLFVVGAAHLSGKYGLIRLLRSSGIKITPVS